MLNFSIILIENTLHTLGFVMPNVLQTIVLLLLYLPAGV